MSTDLGSRDERLRSVFLFTGVGLTSNVYVIGENSITLVDAGNGSVANRIIPRLHRLGLDARSVRQLVLTHLHLDHVGGMTEITGKTSAKVLLFHEDAKLLDLDRARTVGLRDGDSVKTEKGPLTVIHTPGHTRGSICLFDEKRSILFSGDTVFSGGSFGRCDLESGGIQDMISSLERLSKLEVDALLPGHGNCVLRRASAHIQMSLESAKEYV
jgi:hydroxyacylglutathione hydrolase